MPDSLDVVGKWWRFDRYEIVNERIRPAPGAKLSSYQPWALYEEVGRMRSTSEAPYSTLIALAGQLEFAPSKEQFGPSLVATTISKHAILHWCQRFGTLGILPSQVLQFHIAPRWITMAEAFKSAGSKDPVAPLHNERLCPQQKTHRRYYSGWTTQRTHAMSGLITDLNQLGSLVPGEYLNPNWPEPGALVIDSDSGHFKTIPFTNYYGWRQFFPDVPDSEVKSFPYPRVLSDEFWQMYAEPVWEFAQFAIKLKRAVEVLANFDPKKPYADQEMLEIGDLYKFINTLASHVNPCLNVDRNTGDKTQYWACSSLIATLAMMAIMDIARGRLPSICDTCGTVFVSVSSKARYCSSKCRGTMQMRRHRAKQKAAEGLV